jgi:hypothetical protein
MRWQARGTSPIPMRFVGCEGPFLHFTIKEQPSVARGLHTTNRGRVVITEESSEVMTIGEPLYQVLFGDLKTRFFNAPKTSNQSRETNKSALGTKMSSLRSRFRSHRSRSLTQQKNEIGAGCAGSIFVPTILMLAQFEAVSCTQQMFFFTFNEHQSSLLYKDEMSGEAVARRGVCYLGTRR